MARDLDFIYVGAPKSGSSWLFEALREHPGAYLVPSKSSGFFETDTPGSLEQYRALFDPANAGQKCGEIAHDAYLWPDTAWRLHDAFPDARILACLREPGDFAISTLSWWKTHTDRFGSDVTAMATDPGFRSRMDYVGCLKPFFDAFPPEQVKVLFFDELVADPAHFYRELCVFLGLDPAFRPSVLRKIVNRARSPRFAAVTKAIYALGGAFRRFGLGGLVERVKRVGVIDAMLYDEDRANTSLDIAEAAWRERQLARGHLETLERLIGRSVPSSWRQA